jgi:polynucleotide 5'-hydroxyl-kinase GRC3/NOL9
VFILGHPAALESDVAADMSIKLVKAQTPSAKNLRQMTYMSYFGAMQNAIVADSKDRQVISLRSIGNIITRQPPYEIGWESLAFCIPDLDFQLDRTIDALRLAMVGLCCASSSQMSSLGLQDTHLAGLRVTRSIPSDIRCVGIGLVRAIDISDSKVYLLTPVDLRLLEQVNLCVVGAEQISAKEFLLPAEPQAVPYMCTNLLQQGKTSMESHKRSF